MNQHMEHKGYLGSVEIDMKDHFVFGRLLFIRDVVSYRSEDLKHIRSAFEAAVDDYLLTCAELHEAPDVPCKGTFNVRIGAELHQKVALAASRQEVSLNEWVKDACAQKALASETRNDTRAGKAAGQQLEASIDEEQTFDLGGNGDWQNQNQTPIQPQYPH
jgi:predicted HicB family RNase H-like nuclease